MADEKVVLMVFVLAVHLVGLMEGSMVDQRVGVLDSVLAETKVVLMVVPKDESTVAMTVASKVVRLVGR